MGIRLQTNIGYGIDIPGLNLDIVSGIWGKEALEDIMDGFWEEVREGIDKEAAFFKGERSKEAHYAHERVMYKPDGELVKSGLIPSVVYEDESGGSNKILLQPAAMDNSDWTRRDNDLDYNMLRFMQGDDFLHTQWVQSNACIYPYTGLIRENLDAPHGYESYWESCYMDLEGGDKMIPKPPFHLWVLLKRLKLVPEDQTTALFLQLRPTFYKFWS